MNIIESNLQFKGLSYGNIPKLLVLHHAEKSICSIQDIHQWHLDKDWAGCGYHFFVRKDGSIYRGRPEDAIGSQCLGVNATSLGICAEGEYMSEQMPEAQKNSIVELCKYLCNKYGINEIKGHKEAWPHTDCPGTNYPLQTIKGLVHTGGSVNATTSKSNSDILKLWSNGDSVKELQEKLIKLGYSISADGIYGPNTYNSVEHFQASNKLSVDGIVGPQTVAELDKAIVAKNVVNISTYKYLQHEIGVVEDNIPGPKTLAACPLVKQGAQGNITKWIQIHLGIAADGIFGYQTLVAVQNFQARHGLGADGIVGQNTWKALLGL